MADIQPSPQRCSLTAILALLANLVRRPARTERRLPLIWLSSRPAGARVLDALEQKLQAPPRYRVPYARVTARSATTHPDLRPLLHDLCTKLAAPRFGGERLWFRHYELVEWLMAQNLSRLGASERAAKIVELLRGRHRPARRPDSGTEGNSLDLAPRYWVAIWLIRRAAPEVLFRAAVSGKIPGLGRRYRWIMRQQYLAPQQSVNFLGLAERLTEGVRQAEDAEQVDKLLVHAFLQDLRRAHARRPLRIEGWRRTAYPVVLLDDAVEGTDGYRLLQLINDVRNETGCGDPLLVVCTSDQVPQPPATVADTVSDPVEHKLRKKDPVYHDPIYRRWARTLPGSRRARADTAWVLPISVAEPDDPEGPLDEVVLASRRPPWFARRSVVVGLVLVLAGSMIGWVGGEHGGLDCLHRPTTGLVSVRSIAGQCIGYSDNSAFRFNDEPSEYKLRYIQNKIYEQNERARKAWEDSERRRPYVSIVYLGSLTGRPTVEGEEAYSAEREELEGLAVAQYAGLQEPATAHHAPLLHIVIANAGAQMEFAGEAVAMLADLAREDPRVVAVVGLVESRTSTAKAVEELNNAGLPALAPTLSADDFYQNSGLYLQISAPNRDLARMVGEYAQSVLEVTEAQIYWTVGKKEDTPIEEDLYVHTLVEDLKSILPGENRVGIAHLGRFRTELREDVCGYRGMVFFAGRWTEFHRFLNTVQRQCGNNRPDHLLGNDSVGRYMANPTLRDTAPDGLPLTYISKSALAACQRLQAAGTPAKFLVWIQRQDLLSPPRCTAGNHPVGERVPLAYDSAMMVVHAVQGLSTTLRPKPWEREWEPSAVSPIAVHSKILQQNREKPFPGISGSIRFGENSGEPVGRLISLLTVTNISAVTEPPTESFHCTITDGPTDDQECTRPGAGS